MPQEIVYGFAYLKKAAAMTNFDLGVLAEEKMKLISAVCDEILEGKHDDQFPLVIWQTGSGTQSNMNFNEVIANRAHVIELAGNLKKAIDLFTPMTMSTSRNRATILTRRGCILQSITRLLSKRLFLQVEKLSDILKSKSDEFMNVVKIGRTHFMDATPLTFGQEFRGYVSQLNHGLRALKNTLDHLSELALGGTAVGTGINTPEGYAVHVANKIAELTGLPFRTAENKFEALAAHDAMVETHGALRQLAISLNKIANDIRMLASGPRSGIGEIIIPANEPGSSIMPGKVNPTQCEALTMVCAQVFGNDSAIAFGGAQGHYELNVFKPVMAANLIQSANLIGDACVSFTENCAVGIEPNYEVIKRHLNNSLMLVTALNTHIGYDKAAKIAKEAHKNGTTLKEEAVKLEYLTAAEFDEWVDPLKMTGLS